MCVTSVLTQSADICGWGALQTRCQGIKCLWLFSRAVPFYDKLLWLPSLLEADHKKRIRSYFFVTHCSLGLQGSQILEMEIQKTYSKLTFKWNLVFKRKRLDPKGAQGQTLLDLIDPKINMQNKKYIWCKKMQMGNALLWHQVVYMCKVFFPGNTELNWHFCKVMF